MSFAMLKTLLWSIKQWDSYSFTKMSWRFSPIPNWWHHERRPCITYMYEARFFTW